ncbi:SDR family NAD(P)-dependent oxidoreductase [Sciscionella sediminilitoris]|uniref:SDR family NAD(P)-dependent oxidoreductase n=1 Tax=Sciscionella sediminilitoris TaxID=1445613 RepID=UPI0004DEFAFF|nr:SDR family NAD(P)-dependent oxidoreductase [Sciscionella sp. SE31]
MTGTFSLDGRTVLLTGAARGIGAALAVGLARAGARLCLVDTESLEETREAVGEPCRTYRFDLAETGRIAGLVDRVRAEAGPLHVLVNNAGIARMQRFNEITPEDWRAVFAVNTDAAFFTAQRVAEHMIADGIEGRIVQISSKNATVAEAGLAHYNASKAAVELITKSLACELGEHGITCNAVAPGMIETGIAEAFPGDLEGLFAAWRERIPLRQEFGTPEDLLGAVLYLCGAASRYVTGTTITVDGGALAEQLPRLRYLPPYRSSLPEKP